MDAPLDAWWDPEACAWVEAAPGGGWRTRDGTTRGRSGDSADPEAPPTDDAQGWLLVVASPGDVVRLDAGVAQPVGSDGLARLRAAEGVVDVTVVGGGRSRSFEAAIADGYALWLRAAPPDEVRVGFGAGSSVVGEADRIFLESLARDRGGWRLRLSGSYSPEGRLEDNQRLARDRAAAVRAVLEAAGVPAEALEVAAPTPPRPGLTAAQQRAVFVTPTRPEAP